MTLKQQIDRAAEQLEDLRNELKHAAETAEKEDAQTAEQIKLAKKRIFQARAILDKAIEELPPWIE